MATRQAPSALAMALHHHPQHQASHRHQNAATSGGLITALNDNDVLLGRGLGPSKFVGNKRFRILADSRKAEYNARVSYNDKAAIAKQVYLAVRLRGGRFLELVRADNGFPPRAVVETGVWQEADPKTALEKCKQLLREKPAPSKEARRMQRNKSRQQQQEASSYVPQDYLTLKNTTISDQSLYSTKLAAASAARLTGPAASSCNNLHSMAYALDAALAGNGTSRTIPSSSSLSFPPPQDSSVLPQSAIDSLLHPPLHGGMLQGVVDDSSFSRLLPLLSQDISNREQGDLIVRQQQQFILQQQRRQQEQQTACFPYFDPLVSYRQSHNNNGMIMHASALPSQSCSRLLLQTTGGRVVDHESLPHQVGLRNYLVDHRGDDKHAADLAALQAARQQVEDAPLAFRARQQQVNATAAASSSASKLPVVFPTARHDGRQDLMLQQLQQKQQHDDDSASSQTTRTTSHPPPPPPLLVATKNSNNNNNNSNATAEQTEDNKREAAIALFAMTLANDRDRDRAARP